jgi:MFS family permease
MKLISLFVSGFFAYSSLSSVFPVIPEYASELGASESLSALTAGAFAIVTAVAMIPFGFLSERYGRVNFMLLGLVVFVLSPVLYLLSTTPVQLLVFRLFHGFGIAMYAPAVNAMVSDLAEETRRGEMIGWLSAAFMLGFVAGPLSGGIVYEIFGISETFILSSIFGILSLVPLRYIDETINRFEINRGITKNTMAATIAVFASTFGSSAVALFAIPFYAPNFGISGSTVGLLISSIFLFSALSRVPAGVLSDVAGRGFVIVSGLLIEVSAIYLFSIPNFELFIATALCGLGMGFANTAGFAMASDSRNRGLAMGLVSSSLNAGIFFGPTFVGVLSETTGFYDMFPLISLLTFLLAVPAVIVLRK